MMKRIINKVLKKIQPINVIIEPECNTNNILDGKVVLITGASRGIGYSICKKFVQAGAITIICGRNAKILEKVAKEINVEKVIPLQWDISNYSILKKNFEKAVSLTGKIDILVNCAGALTENSFYNRFFEITEKDWDIIVDTNLKGMYFMCQEAARYFVDNPRKDGYYHIINICSEMGLRPSVVPYGISKAGAIRLTEGLGKLLAPKKIIVNGINPGAVATEMMGWHTGDSLVRESHPIGRFAVPEEIANLALFLASDVASNIVGEVITSDGGSHLY